MLTGTMIARASSVVSDSIVLVLTLMRIRAKRRDIAGLSKSAHTIRGVLLRNGAFSLAYLYSTWVDCKTIHD